MNSLSGKTLFISGASRGIGLAIALRAARDGANITIAAKTAEPHSKLPCTIYTAAKEIEEAGGSLTCTSEKGQGTTFLLTLPIEHDILSKSEIMS